MFVLVWAPMDDKRRIELAESQIKLLGPYSPILQGARADAKLCYGEKLGPTSGFIFLRGYQNSDMWLKVISFALGREYKIPFF